MSTVFKVIRHVNKESKRWGYYASGDYLNYILRNDAACKCKTLKDQELLSSESREKIKSNATGLFGPDGEYSQEKLLILRKQMKKLAETRIWDSVISFDANQVETQKIFTREKAMIIVQNNMHKLFKNNGWDPDNFEWFGSFHVNTKHPHVHVGFYEKEPQIFNRKTKKYEFIKRGEKVTNVDTMSRFRTQIDNYLDNKAERLINLNNIRDVTKVGLGNQLISWKQAQLSHSFEYKYSNKINALIIELISKLPKQGRLSYGAKNLDEYRTKINDIVDIFVESDDELRNNFQKYVEGIDELANEFLANSQNHVAKTFKNQRMFALYSRLGNLILKEIKDIRPKRPNPYKPIRKPNWFKKWINKGIKVQINMQINREYYYHLQKFQQMQWESIKGLYDKG